MRHVFPFSRFSPILSNLRSSEFLSRNFLFLGNHFLPFRPLQLLATFSDDGAFYNVTKKSPSFFHPKYFSSSSSSSCRPRDPPRVIKMSKDVGLNQNTVYKLVLTGGPCGGKTTGQARLCTFFENLGWRVYRVPEAATILLSGGVKFKDLSPEQAYQFQEDLLKTMMQLEQTFFNLARTQDKDAIIVCDRGTMDASAFISSVMWEDLLKENSWDEVNLRDTRYNQVIHMVSAAKGAEAFYTLEEHTARSEPLELARELDDKASQAWVGHPYFDLVDNSTDFEVKLNRMIQAVCNRLGIDTGDRFEPNAKKRKFLVKYLPPDMEFPQFQDFAVIHDYLVTPNRSTQARIRKRGQNGKWSYMHTIRRPEINNQIVELKMQIAYRDYEILFAQRDKNHATINKVRRCFLWENHYFQMDIYQPPCPKRCEGVILLETYSTKQGSDLTLPDFLCIEREVTDNPDYSMYNLSILDDRRPSFIKHRAGRSDANCDANGDANCDATGDANGDANGDAPGVGENDTK